MPSERVCELTGVLEDTHRWQVGQGSGTKTGRERK